MDLKHTVVLFYKRTVRYKLELLSWSILEGEVTCNIDFKHGEDILAISCEQSRSKTFGGKQLLPKLYHALTLHELHSEQKSLPLTILVAKPGPGDYPLSYRPFSSSCCCPMGPPHHSKTSQLTSELQNPLMTEVQLSVYNLCLFHATNVGIYFRIKSFLCQ